jgi:hypothetical protein
MKQVLHFSAATILLGVGSCMLVGYVQPSQLESAYTIEFRERSVNMATGQSAEFKKTYARRSDGSAVSVQWNKFPGDDREYAWKVIDLIPERKTVSVAEQIEAVSTMYWFPKRANVSNLMPLEGSDFERTGTDVYLEFEIVKSGREDKKLRITRWRAPALGNVILRDEWAFKKDDGSIASITEKIAIDIKPGEPAASLFEIPSNYRELMPSQQADETKLKYYNQHVRDISAYYITDQRYLNSQRYKPRK